MNEFFNDFGGEFSNRSEEINTSSLKTKISDGEAATGNINNINSPEKEGMKAKRRSHPIRSIFIIIIVIAVSFSSGFFITKYVTGEYPNFNLTKIFKNEEDAFNGLIGRGISPPNIARINITDEISKATSVLGGSTFDPDFIMGKVDDLIYDSNNLGIIVYVDSPGGGVYLTKQIYDVFMKYRNTEKKLYFVFGSGAYSGGYFLATAGNKIYADKTSLTGSIGVRMGTQFDLSGLLEKYGIKTETITAGKNKDMGNIFKPMTEEQKEVYQSVVDDAYNQFVDVIVKGRNISKKKVEKLADGRIFTAKQAKKLKLIDAYGNVENAFSDMANTLIEEHKFKGEIRLINYEKETGFFDMLFSRLNISSNYSDFPLDLIEYFTKKNEEKIQYLGG
ncbi:MAG: signal peptide peptidase SppA [Clostridiales Family XIII bacterium]|jgi:protease-4|nr:signal peptide peptidase SppA [Clostridiales Family XIII bacterium]